MQQTKLPGARAIGWFLLLFGLLGMNKSVMIALIFIISGYYIIRGKEFGRKLAIFLSIINLFYIIMSIWRVKVGLPICPSDLYGICSLETNTLLLLYLEMIIYVLTIYYLSRPRNKEQFAIESTGEIQALRDPNKIISTKVLDLEAEMKQLRQELENKKKNTEELKNKARKYFQQTSEDSEIDKVMLIGKNEKVRKKIGEILLENKFITKEQLEKALQYQKQCGGSLTQILLHQGYLDERALVKCLTTQFGFPYLPVSAYEIDSEVLNLIPTDIAERYWFLPVDKEGDSLMVVMIDPLDTNVIKQLEDLTGLKIRPFVGIISEIIAALQVYYKISLKNSQSPLAKMLPFFVDTQVYKGIERRAAIRYKTTIAVKFPALGYYKESQTINVSREGFTLKSVVPLRIGEIISLEVNLPQPYTSLPILALVQVVRCTPLGNDKFEIGVKTIKIAKQELVTIMEYVITHIEG